MGTKYSTVTVSGYNASPPPDDSSQSESNKTKWSGVKTKLGDPLKTALEAVNSALVTAVDQSARSVTAADSTVAGDHNRTIQIASTVTASITISLGDAATMAAGYIVTVANQSNVACVVDRVTASNTINGTTASVSIAALESITFIVNSATNGYVIKNRGRTRGAITSSDFTMTTARLLGRTTASTGAIEEISVARGLDLSGGVLTGITRLPIRGSSSTETLVAADMGKLVRTATASTLTLPALSSVAEGDVVGFYLDASVSVTVQRSGSDTISWNSTDITSVKLTQFGDYLFLIADNNASSRWHVLSEHIQGPYFRSHYDGAGQSIGTATATKLQFNTETVDSHGYYDPTTNFRFTPLIPGWYMVSVSAYISGAAASRAAVILYKNGVEYTYGQRSYSLNDGIYTVAFPVQMNGSTDYVEAYGICVDAAGTFDDLVESRFDAVRIR